jgi:uncharacterized membrane protein YgdD (TMEM256/DUF423 family)
MNDVYKLIRLNVGALAMLLPILSILFGLLGDNGPSWYFSISSTFYANSGPIMVGTLCSAAMFLICYGVVNPYNYWLDSASSILAGICFILIAFFPCTDTELLYVGVLHIPLKVSGIIHNISAMIGFISLSVIVGFCFTKTATTSKNKKRRNIIYTICSIGMLFVMALFAIGSIADYNKSGPFILVYETLLLWLTGIAWFTKAGFIAKDK